MACDFRTASAARRRRVCQARERSMPLLLAASRRRAEFASPITSPDDECAIMVLPLGDLHRTQIVPYVTYGLIAINVAVFLVQQQKGDEFTLAYAATPYEIWHNDDLDQPVAESGHRAGARSVRPWRTP